MIHLSKKKLNEFSIWRGRNMNTPILETERLILRPFKEDDVITVFECWEKDY